MFESLFALRQSLFQSENVIVTENEFENVGSVQDIQTQAASASAPTPSTSAPSVDHDYPIDASTSKDPKDALIEELNEKLRVANEERKSLKEKVRRLTRRCSILRKRKTAMKDGDLPKKTKFKVTRENLKRKKHYSDAQIGNLIHFDTIAHCSKTSFFVQKLNFRNIFQVQFLIITKCLKIITLRIHEKNYENSKH